MFTCVIVHLYIKYKIINFLTKFSIVFQTELLLYFYVYPCTCCFQLYQIFIHYSGHFRDNEISSMASSVFYFSHIIVFSYVKLQVFQKYCQTFFNEIHIINIYINIFKKEVQNLVEI